MRYDRDHLPHEGAVPIVHPDPVDSPGGRTALGLLPPNVQIDGRGMGRNVDPIRDARLANPTAAILESVRLGRRRRLSPRN